MSFLEMLYVENKRQQKPDRHGTANHSASQAGDPLGPLSNPCSGL
jgi:hypothetical protein